MKSLIFSGHMIRAIFAGRKTQTRRVVRMTTRARAAIGDRSPIEAAPGYFHWENLPTAPSFNGEAYNVWCLSYYKPGDQLYVQETFAAHPYHPDALTMPEYEGGHNPAHLVYRADVRDGMIDGFDDTRPKWKSPRYMPRWASRLTIELTEIRLERVQAISEQDAKAEGIGCCGPGGSCCCNSRKFSELWDRINGKRAPWDSNPWVWVLEFRRVED